MPRTRSLAWAELKIGILALLALVITAGLISLVGNQGGFFWQLYELRTHFDNVGGLKEGALVRVAGIEVGTVSDIRFVPSAANVEVVMQLSKDVQSRVTTESRAEIGSLSLLGEALIDIRAATTGDPLPDGGTIESAPVSGDFRQVAASANETLESLGGVLTDLRSGKGTVGKLLTEDALYGDIRTLVGSATDVTRRLSQGEGTLARLVRDPSVYQSLDASLKGLNDVMTRLAAGEGSLGTLLKDEAFARSLSSATAGFDAVATRLNRGEGTIGKLLTEQQLYDRLNELTGRLNDVTTRLGQGEGTLGQLLRDRQLYENMNQTMVELRSLVEDIRKDPRKFLTVRVSIF